MRIISVAFMRPVRLADGVTLDVVNRGTEYMICDGDNGIIVQPANCPGWPPPWTTFVPWVNVAQVNQVFE